MHLNFLFLRGGAKDKIFYTLDGSVPSEESIFYVGPIRVSDASDNVNVWSMREDTSIKFWPDMLDKVSWGSSDYLVPDYLIDKCTVIRAVCIDEDGNVSPVNSAVYFVGFSDKSGYEGVNFLSVMTDPDNLFNPDTGIYVNGSVYDSYEPEENVVEWTWIANYVQKGREWEREACLHFFDTDGNLVLTQNAGIRVQGGASRHNLPRSLNLYARKEYDRSNRFKAGFFENGYEPQRMTLFAGGNDSEVKLKDYLIARITADRNFSTMDFEPYVMFLNGEYWGFYWLTERYDEEYFEYHYRVNDDNVIMVEDNEIKIGKDEDWIIYKEMQEFIINTDFSIDSNYQKACQIIDMDSFIDYYAAEIYIANDDWPDNNYALWRTRDVKEGIYSDGRWRWILFDVNFVNAMALDKAQADMLARTIEEDALFASLMESDEFQQKFASTILNMANTEFLPENINAFVSEFGEAMRERLTKEYARFYGQNNEKSLAFDRRINEVRAFFENRYAYITDYFQ